MVLVLGTIGYVAGVIVTSMTIQTRSKEVLLPVLLLPLSLPLVLPWATADALYMFPNSLYGAKSKRRLHHHHYDLLMLTAGF
ncbi:MAG: hypothetical protein IPH82_23595 [Chloroflexi bacterium]|nr:hypothetical protein [Chloroflexota bacterium]